MQVTIVDRLNHFLYQPLLYQVATAATQEGRHVARNIRRIIRGETVQPFHYVDKGSVASIGRAAAVAEIGRFRLSGLIA